MGMGYNVECGKCNYKKTFFLGSGMMFPRVYESLLADIQNGKYGQEWKEFFETTPGAAVLAEEELYRCSNCNTLLQNYDLSLYVSKDGTPPEHGYWAPWYDHDDYSFVKSYRHICPKCSRRMHKVSLAKISHLPCPVCGSDLEIDENIMWD